MDRTQVADRFGHVGPVRGNRGDCTLECLLGFCRWRGSIGDRNGNGLSDIARGYWRRGSPSMASRVRFAEVVEDGFRMPI